MRRCEHGTDLDEHPCQFRKCLDAARAPALTVVPGGAGTKKEERTIPAPGSGGAGTKKEERTAPPSAPPPAVDPAWLNYGLLGEIVEAVDAGEHTEADPVGVLVTLMAGSGALIGSAVHVTVASVNHPLLVWPLVFGSTGTGRKGESEATARLFLAKVDEFGDLRKSGLSSGEGLIEQIRDVEDENSGGTADKRLFVVEPEFSSVMARTKREGSTLASVLRQAWDGLPLAVLNRKALVASGSHVAIVGHVVPREFRLRLAETEMAGGTYNRFLPIYVERSKRLPLPVPLDESVVEEFGGRLNNAIGKVRAAFPTRVILSAGARDLWSTSLYDEFTGTDDEDEAWTEFARRAAPYALRIGALHAVLNGHSEITADDLRAAGGLVRYSIASARFVLERCARDPRIDRIRRALIGAGQAGLTRTDISGLFSRNLAAKVLDGLLDEITRTGEVAREDVRTGGRPSTRYRAVLSSFFVPPNPDVTEGSP